MPLSRGPHLVDHHRHVFFPHRLAPRNAFDEKRNLSPARVVPIARAGRGRHRIEDTFNAEKNHGIGLEHVFCAQTTASKNYYAMMQVAQIIWTLVCHGYLKRVFQWARKATEHGLARAVWEGLRARRLPPDLPPIGQVRFGYS